jgi:N-acyl homoserine lactone hydrolase
MLTNRQWKVEIVPYWAVAWLLFVLLSLTPCPAIAQPAPLAAPAPVTSLRLYVFECGYITGINPEAYNLTMKDVKDPVMAVPCFLIVHPRGTLLFDTGLGDKWVGRRPFETKMGSSSLIVFETLSSQMDAIGYTPDRINYLALSHMHFDHTGNANEFAGSIWLVQKIEHDAMFSERQPSNYSTYSALKTAKTELLNGDHDVFGDGTVVLKFTPGHTAGHQSLFVKLPKTGPIVLSGDLYHYAEERTMNRMPEREKTSGTAESRMNLEIFMKEVGAQLWIEHDDINFAKLKKSPEHYE